MSSEFRRVASVRKRFGWIGSPGCWPLTRVLGAAIAIPGIALLLTVPGGPVSSVQANNARCLQAFANDAHHSLDELLQDPALQDSLVHAIGQCSR